jgi:hypothetical protein
VALAGTLAGLNDLAVAVGILAGLAQIARFPVTIRLALVTLLLLGGIGLPALLAAGTRPRILALLALLAAFSLHLLVPPVVVAVRPIALALAGFILPFVFHCVSPHREINRPLRTIGLVSMFR